MEKKRELLRHTLATLAYRGGKAVRGAPDSFAGYRASPTSRTPAEILAHVGDLMDWALYLAQGDHRWKDSIPLPWEQEIARFHTAMKSLDDYLADDLPLSLSAEKLFQGPIADALTHVGQLTMLRRMAGAPVRGENYFMAVIEPGQLGPDQELPCREFD